MPDTGPSLATLINAFADQTTADLSHVTTDRASLAALAARVNALGGTPVGSPNTATMPDGEVISLSTTMLVPPGSTFTSDLDLSGQSGGLVKDAVFNGCGVIINPSAPPDFVGCTWNNTPSRGSNGSAIAGNGQQGGRIINGVFNNVQGSVLGSFGWNGVRVLCSSFINPNQVWSMDTGSNGADGNNIEFGWIYVTGEGRGGLETGGDTTPGVGQVFNGLYVHDSIFVDLGLQEVNAIDAISFVARGQKGTRMLRNFFRLGSTYGPGNVQMIEMSITPGQGTAAVIDGNTFLDITNGLCYTDSGGVPSVVTNNMTFNCAQVLDAANGNTVLATRPSDPVPQTALIA